MSNKNRVRLVDVAAKANVSPGTASDALAGKNRIPIETQERVRKIAKELGYTPNPLGKALQTGSLPLIGLLISALDRRAEFDAYRTYWADVLSSATLAAANRGYALVLLSSLESPEVRAIPYAGVIVVDTEENDPDLIDALSLGIPVATDYIQEDPRIGIRFRAEYGDSVPLSLDALKEAGANSFSILMPSVEDAVWVRNVEAAAKEWAKTNSAKVEVVELAVDGSETYKVLESQMADGRNGFYSLMPVDEFMLNFKLLCAEKELVISKDIHLVMLDEDRTGELHDLGVSLVGISADDYSSSIVNALIDQVEGNTDNKLVDIKFVLRLPEGD